MNGFVNRIREGAKRRATYRQVVSELSALSPRELADIGVSSSDIHNIARTAVYG